MSQPADARADIAIKTPRGLSRRIQKLRDYYFMGAARAWTNEYTSWTTAMPWDVQFNEITYYTVPETYALLQTMRNSYRQAARPVALPEKFWNWSIVERRAWFVREVMVNCLPQEILPGDLIAGGRFNIQTSLCLTEAEQKAYDKAILGKKGTRAAVKWFHDHGYGNAGATSGHLIPDHARVLEIGWKGIYAEIDVLYSCLSEREQKGSEGSQLRAMRMAATMPRDLAGKYAAICTKLAVGADDENRRDELVRMAQNLSRVPWEPAQTFWEAIQALWINHMLIMSDENYPGPGLSFGRVDQYLLPYWQASIRSGMDRQFGKEILKCFWIHCNTAYDAMIRSGRDGITSGFGQLITLSGMGPDGRDMTNDLTYAILEVVDEMSPMLEPKPNVRLHRKSPEALLDRLVEMISTSQGAPFLINFDERSMAGLLRQAKMAGIDHLINEVNVCEYAPVGCLENTMVGCDRSGTVDNNLNLIKAVELALTGGKDLAVVEGQKVRQYGHSTGDPAMFAEWEDFWNAYARQTAYIIKRCVDLYERTEAIRSAWFPTPYLSCLVDGCSEKALDITRGGARINFTTIEAGTFATTVDSLLAIKYLVFDEKKCTMSELVEALKSNWESCPILRDLAKNGAPKYGRDDYIADIMAVEVMDLWTSETWKHRTVSTNRRFRPGMLSWNYFAGDGFIIAATADGRKKGETLSNGICPSNGADINGPVASANSVGKALGGRTASGMGDWQDYQNNMPGGASHTISFHPSLVSDPEYREKLKAFFRRYAENGGTCLQINVVDPEMLREAQQNPQNYRDLLVRITGYSAYFTAIGKELQNEVISRISHDSM